MTTAPTDRDLGQAVLALDEMLRDPRCHGLLQAVRDTAPDWLLDQLDAAADDNHRHLVAEAAVLDGAVSYVRADETPEWVTLGALHVLLDWHAGRARTCMHAPHPHRPEPVVAAAWRPRLIACVRCTHLLELPRGSDGDRRCDSCGHVTTGVENGTASPRPGSASAL